MNAETCQPLFITGTYRSGSNFLCNRINTSPRALILPDLFHFFRYIYGETPLAEKNLSQIVEDFSWRMKKRHDIILSARELIQALPLRDLSYKDIYTGFMNALVTISAEKNLRIIGEKTSQDWTKIPIFLNLLDTAKVIHIYRDPRAVLSSWKRVTKQPSPLYLDALFTSIDSLNKVEKYRQALDKSKYLPVRYETLILHPEDEMRRICKFIGLRFEPKMLTAPMNLGGFKGRIDATFSVFGHDTTPFDQKSLHIWESHCDPWETALTEFLAGNLMKRFGYDPVIKTVAPSLIRQGLDTICTTPYLLNQYIRLITTGSCREGYPNDPRDPKNWGNRKAKG